LWRFPALFEYWQAALPQNGRRVVANTELEDPGCALHPLSPRRSADPDPFVGEHVAQSGGESLLLDLVQATQKVEDRLPAVLLVELELPSRRTHRRPKLRAALDGSLDRSTRGRLTRKQAAQLRKEIEDDRGHRVRQILLHARGTEGIHEMGEIYGRQERE